MADPRLVVPNKRKDPASPLMQAKRASSSGEVVNFCPFGCADDRLDDHGYCAHLVGFTTDGRVMEPRVKRADGRVIVAGGSKRRPLLKGDRLVKITTSARVYRSTPVASLEPPRLDEPATLFDEREEKLRAQLRELQSPTLEGLAHTAYDADPDDPDDAGDGDQGDVDDQDDDELEKATRPNP